MRALDDVVRSGKARYVGFSNLPAWLASKAITFAEAQRPRALPERAGLLLDRRPRHRARDRAAVPGRGRRDPAVEPARGRPALGQVRSRQEGPGGRAARLVRLPAGEHGAPAARARGAARRSPRRRNVSVARVALALAAHAAVRHERHHRREEAASSSSTTSRRPSVKLSRRAREAPRRGERAARRVPGLDGRLPEPRRARRAAEVTLCAGAGRPCYGARARRGSNGRTSGEVVARWCVGGARRHPLGSNRGGRHASHRPPACIVVELAAVAVPRWRHLRHGGPSGMPRSAFDAAVRARRRPRGVPWPSVWRRPAIGSPRPTRSGLSPCR